MPRVHLSTFTSHQKGGCVLSIFATNALPQPLTDLGNPGTASCMTLGKPAVGGIPQTVGIQTVSFCTSSTSQIWPVLVHTGIKKTAKTQQAVDRSAFYRTPLEHH